jgi:ABC-type dipeptide/oligopeptide/nickel transport system permease subunit
VLVVLLATGAIVGPRVTPHDPLKTDFSSLLAPPSMTHPLGTDRLGRDLLSRTLYGGRVSLAVGALSILVGMTLGVPVGLVGGYLGGWVDSVLMRVADATLILPSLILAATIALFLGPSLTNVILAIGLVRWPVFARLVRGQVLTIKEREYVLAAHALGAPTSRILRRHVLPNASTVVIVEASLSAGFAMFTEASLSFLGAGVPPPTPTWGGMLREGYSYLELAPWASLVPGGALFLGILAFNFLGDGLRDLVDPTLYRSH